MNTRLRRNVSAISLLEHTDVSQDFTPQFAASGWSFRKTIHPLDSHPMAVAMTNEISNESGTRYRPAQPRARLFLSAVRLGSDAASIETTMGLDLNMTDALGPIQREHLEGSLRGPGSMFPPIDGGTVTKYTCRIRSRWSGFPATPPASAAPDIVLYRGTATFVKSGEVCISLLRQFHGSTTSRQVRSTSRP